MSYRAFPADVEELAAEWASEPCSDIAWEDLGPFGGTESKVQHGNLVAIAKPGVPKGDGTPRAAHEKIASDLAYHLGFPVPPVTLWDRGAGTPDGCERLVAVSAWAFPGADDWGKMAHLLTETHTQEASRVFSAMLAFEAWIGATDRKAAHTLMALDPENATLRLAFIDYAFSMSRTWKDENAPYNKLKAYFPLNLDTYALEDGMLRIRQLNDESVSDLVSRIPASFLPEAKQDTIIANLQRRKKRLPDLIGSR